MPAVIISENIVMGLILLAVVLFLPGFIVTISVLLLIRNLYNPALFTFSNCFTLGPGILFLALILSKLISEWTGMDRGKGSPVIMVVAFVIVSLTMFNLRGLYLNGYNNWQDVLPRYSGAALLYSLLTPPLFYAIYFMLKYFLEPK
jgi:hypothetical protein